jgi:hypothetical protein
MIIRSNIISFLGLGAYLFLTYICFCLYAAGVSTVELQNAIQAKDVDKTIKYIAIELIQKSMSDQLSSKLLDASLKIHEGSSASAVGLTEVSLALTIIRNATGTYISREGIERMFKMSDAQSQETRGNKVAKVYKALISDEFLPSDNIEFLSPFILQATAVDSKNRTYRFIFELYSYYWVLTDIRLDLDKISNQEISDYLTRFLTP